MATFHKRAAIKKLKKLVFTQKTDLALFRDSIDKTFASALLPNHVECRPVTVHGIPSDMLIPQVSSNRRMILYVHGGSFMGGSRFAWRSFCASLANEASSRVLVPEYRLAPEHAFPAAIEDTLAVFKRMSDHHVDVFLAGDGSGAAIAVATALSIPQNLRHCFKGMLLFSPWLDLSENSAMYTKRTADPLFTADSMRYCGAYYTYSANLENPLVSPLRAENEHYINFPPVHIQCGAQELTLPCTRLFAEKLKSVGVDCSLQVFNGLFHFFQFVHEEVPAAHLAVEQAGKFIRNIESAPQGMTEEDDLWS